jgi:hypothetical protein
VEGPREAQLRAGDEDGTFTVQGAAALFGFQPSPVEVTLRRRARSWRVGGAARTMGVAVVVAPVVAIVPPHAPWLIGVLAVGGILARRRLHEHFTVTAVRGACPKCEAQISSGAGRLRTPHPLPCEACHHDATLRLPEDALEAS